MPEHIDKEQVAAFMKGMLFGLVAGAAGGILLAPQSGKETREDIKKGILKAQKTVGKQAGKFSEYIKENAEEISDKISRAKEELKK